jgi:hypothetical protein
MCSGPAKYADLSGTSSTCTGNAKTSNYATLSGTASVCSGAAKYADLSGISSLCTGTSSYAKYAWLSGNSTTCGTANYAKLAATATECVGTGYYLRSTGLKVNTDQLVVTGGNVGVGTTAPGTKLDVYGSLGAVNFRTNGEARFGGTNNYSHFNYSSGEDTYLRGGKSTSNVYIKDYAGGNIYMAGSGGNVGIGTSTLNQKLAVNGNIAITSYPGNLMIGGNGVDENWSVIKAQTGLLTINKGGWASVSIPSGNVGIGNTNPGTKLDVTGNIRLSGTHLTYNSAHGVIDWGSGSSGNLYFRTLSTQGNNTTYTDRVIFYNNGQVQITGGSPGAGKVLTSDSNGLATWQTPSTSTTARLIGLSTNVFGTLSPLIPNVGDTIKISGEMAFKSGGSNASGTFYYAKRASSDMITINWGGGYSYIPSPWGFTSGGKFSDFGVTDMIFVY